MSERPTSVATIDPREFRDCLGRFAIGVTVITAEVNGHVYRLTVNAFMSVSLDRPAYHGQR
jgi:flavin reductase (DIM6/NTAB) family NADH-FMN oxidoreductase RutF